MSIEIGSLPLATNERHSVDARENALASMLQAIAHLDSDDTISPIIAAHLQLAIDTLRMTIDGHEALVDFHI